MYEEDPFLAPDRQGTTTWKEYFHVIFFVWVGRGAKGGVKISSHSLAANRN